MTRYTPVQVKWQDGRPFDGAVAVEGGDGFGMLTRQDGSVWAMGLNDGGRLGDGTRNLSRYPVKVKLYSTNANLNALTISAGTLRPGFSPNITDYSMAVDSGVSSITLVPTTADKLATVTVSVYGGQPVSVPSGQSSPPLQLTAGQNEVTVKVTAEDPSSTKVYRIKITRNAILNNVLPATGITDTTPPVTTAALSPSQPVQTSGWFAGPVTITLHTTDNASSVTGTVYSINGSEWRPYSKPLTLDQDGMIAVNFRSTDQSGNIEAVQTVTVKIARKPEDVVPMQ
ncbi:cadherin-like beta sandwich domain-containing protein [Paenibacillus sp. P26]|nr:cadherin-like beta sandwich domain-containing protein [Paenibacillus sp. P26]